jgi:hypothetical protein
MRPVPFAESARPRLVKSYVLVVAGLHVNPAIGRRPPVRPEFSSGLLKAPPGPGSPHGREHFWPERHLQPDERHGRDEYGDEEPCLTTIKQETQSKINEDAEDRKHPGKDHTEHERLPNAALPFRQAEVVPLDGTWEVTLATATRKSIRSHRRPTMGLAESEVLGRIARTFVADVSVGAFRKTARWKASDGANQ